MFNKEFKKYFNYFVFVVLAFFPFIDYFVRKFNIPFSNLWDDAFIVLTFFVSLFVGAKKIKKLLNNPTFLFDVIFLSVSLFSFYFNNYSIFIYINEARILFEPFLIYVAIVLLEPEKEEIHFFIKSIILSYCLLALHGMYQYIKKVPTPSEWVDKDLEGAVIKTRAFSVVRGPNILGDYLELSLPLPLIYVFKEKSNSRKILWVIPFLIISGGLIVTLSRSAWLASTFSIFLSGFWLSLLLGIVFILIALMLLIFVKPIRIRILSLFTRTYLEKSMKSGGRIYQWTSGVINASEHPLLGTGLGTYGGVASYSYGFVARRSIDSAYIKILSETGWLGIVSFIPWVSWGVGSILTRFRDEKDVIFLFIGAGLLAFLLNLFTQNIFIAMGPGTIVFWALTAVGIVYHD